MSGSYPNSYDHATSAPIIDDAQARKSGYGRKCVKEDSARMDHDVECLVKQPVETSSTKHTSLGNLMACAPPISCLEPSGPPW